MMAERDTTDRYLAAFLADRVGSEFPGAIAGVARFGLFVKLDETGADGLVPISSLGSEFPGTVAGVARFGLFVKLDDTGADGLVPISSLGREYFSYDPDSQTLTGEKSRRVIGLGQRVLVRLAEAVPITGGLLFELLEVEGRKLPAPPRREPKGPPRRKLGQSRTRKRADAKRDRRR
jgi:ribonuclease R